MNAIKIKNSGYIRVADITLGQLSRGLYRSTAAAFKELASNAYDADATEIKIDTNYPEFDFISLVDNGMGMSLGQFLMYFDKEGIGSCFKRKKGKKITDIYRRPIIGRLGIGMLAIGQLCHSFEIESHYNENGKGKAYRAEIILSDVKIPDKEDFLTNDDVKTKKLPVGKWKYEIIDYDEAKKGFRIYSSDVRGTFSHEMKSSIGEKEHEKMSFILSDLHSEFYEKSRKSIRHCKPYLETIWELSILCPLPYYGKNGEYPINMDFFSLKKSKSDGFEKAIQLIEERQNQFLNNKFRVIFNGIELRRLIQLHTEKETVPKLYFIRFDDIVFDARLKFKGYLFAQIPRAIRPIELNGVQIRLRGVGIGGYDSTFLKYYEQIETIRSKWVSGEIFIYEGLESALNIDRDSFNEHDEHFKKLQSVIHEKLNLVFDEISKIAKERSDKIRDRKDDEIKNRMREIVTKQSKGKFKLSQIDSGENESIVVVDKEKGEIILNIAARPLKKKRPDMIIRVVELAYHIAKHTAETDEERDDLFLQFIKDIFSKLI